MTDPTVADVIPSPRQTAAIEAPLGPVLVVAGPGAGKTFCLIERVGHLVHHLGFLPEHICAVTFTNKAADEIAARLGRKLGDAARAVTRSTLHALCLGILREEGSAVGLRRDFGIADEDHQAALLRRLNVPRRRHTQLINKFSQKRFRAAVIDPEEESLFRQYEQLLRDRNLLDFDQLILFTDRLFVEHRDVLERVRSQWHYLLVDEFQDLNLVQYSIVQHLAGEHRNIFVVGDDEQSIFSWTGADPALLRAFREDFDVAEPVVLDRNHRSARQIFEVATRILARNPSLFEKEIHSHRNTEHVVEARLFPHDDAEADWIVQDVLDRIREHGVDWGGMAVLYRLHVVGERLEKRFIEAGIPCRVARGRALQDDKVVGFVAASLRLMQSPDDASAVEAFASKVLSAPLLEQIQALNADPDDFVGALRAYAGRHPREEPDTRKVWRCIYHIDNLQALYQSHHTLGGLVEELLSQRVGPYQSPLEEHHLELSDPVRYPGAAELATEIDRAIRDRARVWVEPEDGLGIGLRGLLSAGCGVAVGYLTSDANPDPSDVVLRREPGVSLPLRVFKALQVLESRHFADVFQDYVAFDLETTDKDPATCEIVEIGAVRVRGGQVIDRFHAHVRPDQPISPGARAVHGYSEHDLADAPPFAEVWPGFRAFVGDDLVVAHNGHNFDVPVLRRMADGLDGIDRMVFFDTLPLAKSLSPESAKLEDLAARFHVETGRSHHALDDAEALAGVMSALGAEKVVRARKAASVRVLDFLGLALGLDSPRDTSDESSLLEGLARPYVLGRFTACLDFYSDHRVTYALEDVTPTIDEVIARLGGPGMRKRFQTHRTARQRYPEAMARLHDLINASEAATLSDAIGNLLGRVALSTSGEIELDPHRVNLLTLHATKGLEFDEVYIVGVEDYQIPGYYAVTDGREDEFEEARRLLYVGMTRARDRLVLTAAEARGGKPAGGRMFLRELGLDPVQV